MLIREGIKQKGRPFEIPDCSRNDLPEFFKEMGYKVGVEIGVYKGAFTTHFARTGLEIYGIDPWFPYEDFDIVGDRRKSRQEFLYQHSKRTLKPYKNVEIIRKTSLEAAKDFGNESIDFVYIDGNHKLRYVVEDLCEWSKKVKKGGAISGHDYIHPARTSFRWETLHVKFAVDAFIDAYRVNNWYVLGSKDGKEGEKRDKFRSYLWIKE